MHLDILYGHNLKKNQIDLVQIQLFISSWLFCSPSLNALSSKRTIGTLFPNSFSKSKWYKVTRRYYKIMAIWKLKFSHLELEDVNGGGNSILDSWNTQYSGSVFNLIDLSIFQMGKELARRVHFLGSKISSRIAVTSFLSSPQ